MLKKGMERFFCSGKGGIGGRKDGCSESSESVRRWALLGRLLSFDKRFKVDFDLRSSPENEEPLWDIDILEAKPKDREKDEGFEVGGVGCD